MKRIVVNKFSNQKKKQREKKGVTDRDRFGQLWSNIPHCDSDNSPVSTRLNHLFLSSRSVYVCIFVEFQIKLNMYKAPPPPILKVAYPSPQDNGHLKTQVLKSYDKQYC